MRKQPVAAQPWLSANQRLHLLGNQRLPCTASLGGYDSVSIQSHPGRVPSLAWGQAHILSYLIRALSSNSASCALRSMPRLLDLSNEIIDRILSYIADDESSLCSLATTNRRLSELSQRLLYRHLAVSVISPELSRINSYACLLRTLAHSPKLGKQVLSVKLHWAARMNGEGYIPDMANRRANNLLTRLPNIKGLEIAHRNHRYEPFTADFLHENPVSKLQKVTHVDIQMTVSEIAQYFKVPSLEEIRVGGIKLSQVTLSSTYVNIALDEGRHTSSLNILDLGSSHHLPPSTLRSLLSIPRSVRALLCTFPGYQPSLPKFNNICKIKMLQPLSPHSTAAALTPLQYCLVELYLTSGARTYWPGHDGSRLDLSMFTKLEIMEVPASCYFSVGEGAWHERRNMWRLLPGSLRKLKVRKDNKSQLTKDALLISEAGR